MSPDNTYNLHESDDLTGAGGFEDRGRSKKRNFFGTLKKRLSRSKTRTHSADRGALTSQHNNNLTTPTGTLNGDSRSLSVDRAVLSKSNSLGNYLSSQHQFHCHFTIHLFTQSLALFHSLCSCCSLKEFMLKFLFFSFFSWIYAHF